MFVIPESQMVQLAMHTRQPFIEMMMRYLRQYFPVRVDPFSDTVLRAWIQQAVDKAISYGVHLEPEVAQLVLLFLVLGLSADEAHGWVKETLADSDLQGSGKVRRLIALSYERRVDGIEDVIVYD